MSVRRPSKVWHRQPGSGQITVPETDRDDRVWVRELPNGFLVEEVGEPPNRLPAEPQPVLVKNTAEPPSEAPPASSPSTVGGGPTPAAADRLRNPRAITRNA